MNVFWQVLRREMLIAFRQRADIVNPLWFFVMVVTLFPLSIGPALENLQIFAPGIIWVAALLAAMLSLERLFRDDYLDGSLEQQMLMPSSLSLVVLAKVFAHWLLTGVPLILFSPILALLLGLDMQVWQATALSLLVGTPILSLIGAIGVGLTVALRRGGVLLTLLVMPLYIPVLIFSTGIIQAAQLGMPYSGQLAMLAAMMLVAVGLAPFATAAALRVSVQ
ncbi:Heme exporter protein B [Vibrio stylophorae]|uniref:Heme exporter protein B n=2 Tax=Vibrio stylophorae TaxID=659351 RepID=A0ABN8DSL6_9VIBR|nr:Heme exporter protein B [Vibrio stylophorae]